MPWQDLQYFLAAAKGGSLAAAAATLGVSSATVHRRLSELERRLSARLFARSPRGYALTAAGEELLTHAMAIETEVLSAQRRLGGRDEQIVGTVRVSTVDDLVINVLGGVMRDFARLHQRVRLDVAISSGHADLAQRQADVAIRPGSHPKEDDVIARRICAVGVALYASADYLAQHGAPGSPHTWAAHRIVRGDESMASISMERFLDRFVPASAAVCRSDAMLARQTAVREGLGIGLLPCFAADTDPQLVRLSEVWREASAVLWIVVHADLRRNARVRAFVEFVHDALIGMRARFEGTAPEADRT